MAISNVLAPATINFSKNFIPVKFQSDSYLDGSGNEKENYRINVELWVENEANTTFELANTQPLQLKYGSAGQAETDFKDILHTLLENAGPDYMDFAQTAILACKKSVRKFYFKYAESIDGVLGTVTTSATFTAIYGGLSYTGSFSSSLLGLIQPNEVDRSQDRFLRQGNNQQYTRTNQPQFLYFLNTRATEILHLKVKFYFSDDTVLEKTITTGTVTNARKYAYNVKFDAILSGVEADSRQCTYYEVWLQNTSDTVLSETRTFYLNYEIREYVKYFLYYSSWGSVDTLITYGKGVSEIDITQSDAGIIRQSGNDIKEGNGHVFDIKVNTTFKVATGFFSKIEIGLKRDFYLSPFKFRYSAGNLLPISLTSKNITEFTDGNGLFAQNFDYKYLFDDDCYTEGDIEDNGLGLSNFFFSSNPTNPTQGFGETDPTVPIWVKTISLADIARWDSGVGTSGGGGGGSVYSSDLVLARLQRLEDVAAPFLDEDKGGMVLWNRPAIDIPAGWQEVVDWRGRLPMGYNPDDVLFNTVGEFGGSKNKTLNISEIPEISLPYDKTTLGLDFGSGSTRSSYTAKTTDNLAFGGGQEFSILNPYRVVVFIEYIGSDVAIPTPSLRDRFKGVYLTVEALRAAYPIAEVGDYAQINGIGAETVINYLWDAELLDWVAGGAVASGAINTDTLPEGSNNLYFTFARVLATVLTGLSIPTASAIAATDSLLTAFGKLQAQINGKARLSEDNIFTGVQNFDNTDSNAGLLFTSYGQNNGNIKYDRTSGNLYFNFYAPGTQVLETGFSVNRITKKVKFYGTVEGLDPVDDQDYVTKAFLDLGLALKLDASSYNDRFKGKFTTLLALETALPTANAGDYAQVDAGSGSDVINYNYDLEDGWIEGGSGSAATDTDMLPEGASNLYFTTARALAAAPAETTTTLGALTNGATAKATPVDADMIPLMDSAASNVVKKLSWANIKATLKTYIEATAFITSASWQMARLGLGVTANAATYLVTGANTAAIGSWLMTPSAADYTGTLLGMFWNNAGEIKFVDTGSIVNRLLKTYNNALYKGTGTRVAVFNAYGDLSATDIVEEQFVSDTVVITAITGATYTSNRATITPASSKVMYQGQLYDDGTYTYLAIDDNLVRRW